ncbi:MAG: hypothetical protein AAF433_08530 [Bacteroidota bacterium]
MIRILVLYLSFLGWTGIHAQDMVEEKLIGIAQHLENGDFSATDEFDYIYIPNQGDVTIPIELNATKRFNIWGVCDENCVDIDFRLANAAGEIVEVDQLNDAMPLIAVNAPATGTYQLSITMYNCKTDSCRVGVGTFAAPAITDYANPTLGLEGDNAEAVVNNQLNFLANEMQNQGWNPLQESSFFNLAASGEESVSLDLTAGTAIKLWGVCDKNCADMDLVLLDAERNLVVEDVLIDAQPTLEITAPDTGTYILIARMYQCVEEPCRVGLSYWTR